MFLQWHALYVLLCIIAMPLYGGESALLIPPKMSSYATFSAYNEAFKKTYHQEIQDRFNRVHEALIHEDNKKKRKELEQVAQQTEKKILITDLEQLAEKDDHHIARYMLAYHEITGGFPLCDTYAIKPRLFLKTFDRNNALDETMADQSFSYLNGNRYFPARLLLAQLFVWTGNKQWADMQFKNAMEPSMICIYDAQLKQSFPVQYIHEPTYRSAYYKVKKEGALLEAFSLLRSLCQIRYDGWKKELFSYAFLPDGAFAYRQSADKNQQSTELCAVPADSSVKHNPLLVSPQISSYATFAAYNNMYKNKYISELRVLFDGACEKLTCGNNADAVVEFAKAAECGHHIAQYVIAYSTLTGECPPMETYATTPALFSQAFDSNEHQQKIDRCFEYLATNTYVPAQFLFSQLAAWVGQHGLSDHLGMQALRAVDFGVYDEKSKLMLPLIWLYEPAYARLYEHLIRHRCFPEAFNTVGLLCQLNDTKWITELKKFSSNAASEIVYQETLQTMPTVRHQDDQKQDAVQGVDKKQKPSEPIKKTVAKEPTKSGLSEELCKAHQLEVEAVVEEKDQHPLVFVELWKQATTDKNGPQLNKIALYLLQADYEIHTLSIKSLGAVVTAYLQAADYQKKYISQLPFDLTGRNVKKPLQDAPQLLKTVELAKSNGILQNPIDIRNLYLAVGEYTKAFAVTKSEYRNTGILDEWIINTLNPEQLMQISELMEMKKGQGISVDSTLSKGIRNKLFELLENSVKNKNVIVQYKELLEKIVSNNENDCKL
ncbi:MAG: hypothetical protein WCE21_00625, partial [Candidatus Babeliales bacterium]